MSFKLAIIGAGYIAEEHLKAVDLVEGLEVDLIYSRTSLKASSLAKKFSIKHVVTELDSFINLAKELDGILITVSAENMFKICNDLLPLKIPLFIEKHLIQHHQSLKNFPRIGGKEDFKHINSLNFFLKNIKLNIKKT